MQFKFSQSFFFSHDKNIKWVGKRSHKSHYHNLFEIYFITEGKCTYFVDGTRYNLRAGDLIFIPQGIIHNTEYVDSIHSRILINCSEKYIPECVQNFFSDGALLWRTEDDGISQILKKIEQEYLHPGEYADKYLEAYTNILFLTVAKNKNRYIPSAKGKDYMQKALDYIHENYCHNISLEEVAGICRVSPEHFSRTFSGETGFSFCRYINELRMKKAEAALRRGDNVSIAELAADCGFNDSNYFSLKFKKMYGISPKKFQLENKK